MSKKRIDLDDPSLQGFEEIYDLLQEEEEFENKDKFRKHRVQQNHTCETLDFLNNELLRLVQLDVFLAKKTNNLLSYPQTDALLDKQQEKVVFLREDIVERSSYPDSPLQQHLKNLWNKTYVGGRPS